MFRIPLLIAISLCIAFGGGIYFTQYAIRYSTGFGAISLGAWQAFPKAQSADADPYAKNHRAKAGRLLLASAEGLVFSAVNDDDGDRLDAGCDYTLSGDTPPARFWILHVATLENDPLSKAPGIPLSLNSRNVLYRRDGSLEIALSATAKPENWLAMPKDEKFKLVLTLLDTPAAGSSGLIGLSMPEIRKVACEDV
jgi:hypothetical protein